MPTQQFTSQQIPIGFTALNGGLNSTSSALNLKDTEASSLQNIDFDVFGSIKKRNGYTKLNSSAFNSGATFTGLFWFELSSGTKYLVGTCGDKIAKMDDLDGTWDDISAALTITAGNNNLFSFAVLNDTLLATNDVDPVIKWTGSGNAAAADVPTGLTDAKFVASWNNYAFYANVLVSGTRYASRIYWSNIGDPTTWTATDFNDVNENDGQQITGIKPLGDRFVIFKNKSIWIMNFTGDSDIPFTFVKSPSHVGCASGYSIQEVQNGLIFLSDDGYYYFDGINSTKLSDRITTTLNTFGKNRFEYSCSAYQKTKNRYWGAFTVSGGSTHNRCITWDDQNNAFSYYKGHNPNCFAIVTTSGDERIYFGDYSGFVYRADSGTSDHPATDTDTAIDAYWKSKWFNFGDIVDQKGVPSIVVYYQYASNDGATLRMGYSYDLESSDQFSQILSITTTGDKWDQFLWDVGEWAGSGGNVERRDLDGRGRLIRVSFYNDIVDDDFQVDGFGFTGYLETRI